jgi:hypothetical protein
MSETTQGVINNLVISGGFSRVNAEMLLKAYFDGGLDEEASAIIRRMSQRPEKDWHLNKTNAHHLNKYNLAFTNDGGQATQPRRKRRIV